MGSEPSTRCGKISPLLRVSVWGKDESVHTKDCDETLLIWEREPRAQAQEDTLLQARASLSQVKGP